MHPLLAALIPTLLLGFSILFLIIRLQNKLKLIAELEEKLRAPAPKIIRREGITQPHFSAEETSADAEAETVPAPQPAYFDSSDSLLATLSHELKTPLNGIMGIAQMLREENDDSEQLMELEGCAHHMHSVLHTLTNLARIQNENEFLPQFREWVFAGCD